MNKPNLWFHILINATGGLHLNQKKQQIEFKTVEII